MLAWDNLAISKMEKDLVMTNNLVTILHVDVEITKYKILHNENVLAA